MSEADVVERHAKNYVLEYAYRLENGSVPKDAFDAVYSKSKRNQFEPIIRTFNDIYIDSINN